MAKNNKKLTALHSVLSGVDDTYVNLPLRLRLQIERVSQGLAELGPRKLGRRGQGTEFYESRDFRRGVDDPRAINARLSARAGRSIVIEREAEISQHFYLWRDASASMNYQSKNGPFTKKETAEIMLLAFAKHLAKNEEKIGILDRQGMYRGGKASDWLTNELVNVSVVTGNMPVINRKLPRNSTVVLFSDFLVDKNKPGNELVQALDQLRGAELKGYLVMVLDPQELDFRFSGHVKFQGLEGEGQHVFQKAQSQQTAYQKAMKEQIDWVRQLCLAKGFKLIIQRTDEPLHDGLMSIYGLSPKGPATKRGPSPKP